MRRIRIKRVKRSPHFNPTRLDDKFVNATIPRIPVVGESLNVVFDRLGYGSWQTTDVIKRRAGKTVVILQTRNSTYHIKLGWGK